MRRIILLLIIFLIMSITVFTYEKPLPKQHNPFIITKEKAIKNAPVTIRVYLAAIKYTDGYVATVDELLKCAKQETSYKGIYQLNYNPYVTSFAKAQGVWQIRVIAARQAWGHKLDSLSDQQLNEKLKYDIEFNCETAVKYLQYLNSIYNNKLMIYSAYNKGPGNVKIIEDINDYARNIIN